MAYRKKWLIAVAVLVNVLAPQPCSPDKKREYESQSYNSSNHRFKVMVHEDRTAILADVSGESARVIGEFRFSHLPTRVDIRNDGARLVALGNWVGDYPDSIVLSILTSEGKELAQHRVRDFVDPERIQPDFQSVRWAEEVGGFSPDGRFYAFTDVRSRRVEFDLETGKRTGVTTPEDEPRAHLPFPREDSSDGTLRSLSWIAIGMLVVAGMGCILIRLRTVGKRP